MSTNTTVSDSVLNKLSISRVGKATSLFFVTSFVFCISLGLIWPPGEMHTPWLAFVPGVRWLSVQSVALGLVEAAAYGWYVAFVFVLFYNRVSGSRSAGS